MLTVSDSEADVINCIKAGADGYLLRIWSLKIFWRKSRKRPWGKWPSVKSGTNSGLSPAPPRQYNQRPLGLTDQSWYEILTRIAQGHSNKVIARDLTFGWDSPKCMSNTSSKDGHEVSR